MPPKKLFCLLLFEGTFTSFYADKKSRRSHKTVEIKGFLLFLLDNERIRIRNSEKCFANYFLKDRTFTSFFTNKRTYWSHKSVEIEGFLTILAWRWEAPDPDPNLDPYVRLTDPGGPKTYGSYGSGTLLVTDRHSRETKETWESCDETAQVEEGGGVGEDDDDPARNEGERQSDHRPLLT